MQTKHNNNILYFDDYNLLDIALINKTPFYLYSQNKIVENFKDYETAFSENNHLICYSVKANSNLKILSILAELGSGFDIVSGGELHRVLEIGGDPSKIVFSGVGKTEDEIRFAISKNILCFNVESFEELKTINSLAIEMKKIANISIRVNPSINIKTHPYIATGMKDNKFGVDEKEIVSLYTEASLCKGLKITGIDFHIGSQITEISPYKEALEKVCKIIKKLSEKDIKIDHIDIGGGLGILYSDEKLPSKADFVDLITNIIKPFDLKILIEPGRSIVGNAGLLISKVLYTKTTPTKNFAIVDAGMNDFIRPPLYNAYHNIKEVFKSGLNSLVYDVVGPVCESSDFLGKERSLCLSSGDFIAVENVGAYGYVLASNYNTRLKPAEFIIIDKKILLIRKAESIDQLLENEKTCL
jgi:diaminopimelate decarboxylase